MGLPWLRSSCTGRALHSGSGRPRSRSMYRPVLRATWPSQSNTPAMPLFAQGAGRLQLRVALQLGEDVGRGVDQRPVSPGPPTAIEDCVRARCVGEPPRPRDTGRSCSSTGESRHRRMNRARGVAWCSRRDGVIAHKARRRSARGDVHRDFEAEAGSPRTGGFPGHGRSPVRLNGFRPTGPGPAAVNLLDAPLVGCRPQVTGEPPVS